METPHTPLKAGQYRAVESFRRNVQRLSDIYPPERLGFLTMTFPDPVPDIASAQKCLRNIADGRFRSRYQTYIFVFERSPKGRPHYHGLIVARPGVDWRGPKFDLEKIRAGEFRAASEDLLNEWAFLRDVCPRYHFGRHQLEPVGIAGTDGVGYYLSKYLVKSMGSRFLGDERKKFIRYGPGANHHSSSFAPLTPKSRLWRAKMSVIGRHFGATPDDYLPFQRALGPRWAYRIASVISGIGLKNSDMFELPVSVVQELRELDAASRAMCFAREMALNGNDWKSLENDENEILEYI